MPEFSQVIKRLPAITSKFQKRPEVQLIRRESQDSRRSVIEIIKDGFADWPTPNDVLNTLPGFSDASVVPNKVAKLFWAIFTVTALGLTGYQLVDLLIYYVRNPVSTALNQMRYDGGTPVPNITICPINAVNLSYLEEKNLTRDYARLLLASQLSHSIPDSVSTIMQASIERVANAKAEFDTLVQTGKDLQQQILYMTFQCSNFLVKCTMDSEEFDCCAPPTKPIRTQLGTCFRVIQPESRKFRRNVGPAGALTIKINMHKHMVLDDFEASQPEVNSDGTINQAEVPRSLGIVASYAEMEDTGMAEDTVAFTAGMNAYANIETLKFTKKTSKDCSSEKNPKSLKGFEKYSQGKCMAECFYNVTHETCGCGATSTQFERGTYEFCDPVISLQCIAPKIFGTEVDTVVSKYGTNFDTRLSQCQNNCVKDCAFFNYIPTLSYTLMDTTDPDDEKNGIAHLITYSLETAYTDAVDQSTLTWSNLIGQIGGTLGLWLGIQIASIVQLVFYGIAALCFRNQKKKQKAGLY